MHAFPFAKIIFHKVPQQTAYPVFYNDEWIFYEWEKFVIGACAQSGEIYRVSGNVKC